MAVEPPTFRSLVTSFVDFLTVAVHTILYERSIYPQTSFLSARRFNYAVRQNRHPKVCEFVNDAVAAVEAELLKGSVERVAVMIYDKGNTPLERFVFDVSCFPHLPVSEADTPLERTGVNGQKIAVLPTVDMEEQFRATISRLAAGAAALKPLPKGCTFTIVIELKSDGEAPLGHPQPWIPAQAKAPSDSSVTNARGVTKPVRAVSAGDITFETWIEETKTALDPS